MNIKFEINKEARVQFVYETVLRKFMAHRLFLTDEQIEETKSVAMFVARECDHETAWTRFLNIILALRIVPELNYRLRY